MPKFVHELHEAKELFSTLGAEKNILPIIIEKDYWIMHCLWGLQRNGFQFEMKGGTSLSKGWGCIDRFSEDIDIRSTGVKCFNPEYTFVDKLQTICKRFRQYRDRNEERDRPRRFLRHYYDLYKLLEMERVKKFIGTAEYEAYQKEKLRGQDAAEFSSRDPFTIPDEKMYQLFEKEFASLNNLLLSPGPTFKELLHRLRTQAAFF